MGLSVRGAYTYLDTEILGVDEFESVAPSPYTLGDPLIRRPRHQGSLDVRYTHTRTQLFLLVNGRNEMADLEPNFAAVVLTNPGFVTLAAGGSFRLGHGLEAYARVTNLLNRDYEDALGYPAQARSASVASVLLSAGNLRFDYAHRKSAETAASRPRSGERGRFDPVIDDVSLDVADGDIVGILGPNGSGKTTLLRLLSGAVRPQAGHVRLAGADLSTTPARVTARQIAVVPQETSLAFDYSALEIVLMGRYPHLGAFEIEGPDDLAAAMRALQATGTATLADRAFRTLSGGEKQRVVIASALAQLDSAAEGSSRLLLLDEPTASLDLRYQFEIGAVLRRLHEASGITILLSTHDLRFAAALCTRIVLLANGRILAQGRPSEVLTPDLVGRLFDVPSELAAPILASATMAR